MPLCTDWTIRVLDARKTADASRLAPPASSLLDVVQLLVRILPLTAIMALVGGVTGVLWGRLVTYRLRHVVPLSQPPMESRDFESQVARVLFQMFLGAALIGGVLIRSHVPAQAVISSLLWWLGLNWLAIDSVERMYRRRYDDGAVGHDVDQPVQRF